MSFTPNPFDHTGTLDTSHYDGGPALTFRGAHDTVITASVSQALVGQGEGTGAPATTIDESVAGICSAFALSESALETAANNRVQPTQSELSRTY